MGAGSWRLRGYVVETLLAHGSSGEVWRARVAATGEPVALKRIRTADPQAVTRARSEAALLTELDHPHLVRLHALVPTGDASVLVLDLAEGGSLAQLLGSRGRLAPGEVITAVAPVGAALAYLHRNGVVHGDVSAANILFLADGAPLLSDVGVARLTGDVSEVHSTPAYVDPAVAAGCVPGPQSDVFMLAAVALHALTGRPPWAASGPQEALALAARGRLDDVAERLAGAGVSDAMAEVLRRALSVDPQRRGTAADLALDLRHSGEPLAVELTAGRARPGPQPLDDPRDDVSAAGRALPAALPGGPRHAARPVRPARDRSHAASARRGRRGRRGAVTLSSPGDSAAATRLGLGEPALPTRVRTAVKTPPPGSPAVPAGDLVPARAATGAEPDPVPADPSPTDPARPSFARPTSTRGGSGRYPPGQRTPGGAAPPTRLVGPRPRPDIPRPRVRRPASWRDRALAAGVLLVLVAGGGVAWWATHSAPPWAGTPHRVAQTSSLHRAPSGPATVRAPSSGSTSPRSAARAPTRALTRTPTPLTASAARLAAVRGTLDRLDKTRAQAFATRDTRLLRRVYGSTSLLHADAALLARLVPAGCGLRGVRTTYADVRVSRHAGRIAVITTASLSASRLVCRGRVVGAAPAVGPATVRLELTGVRDDARIAAQQVA